jgi:hypothetical protein
MPTQRYPDQQATPNSKIHNGLRRLNPPNLRHLHSILSQN